MTLNIDSMELYTYHKLWNKDKDNGEVYSLKPVKANIKVISSNRVIINNDIEEDSNIKVNRNEKIVDQ